MNYRRTRENLPLIPKSELKYNHDSQSVLREVFQEILEQRTTPANIVKNIATYNVDSEREKETAKTTLALMENTKLKMEDIEIAERKLNYDLTVHAEKQLSQNPKDKEIQRLKKDLLFPKIDRNDTAEYGLMTGYDFKPSKVHCSIDFTYKNNHKCDPVTCPSDLDMFPTKLPSIGTKPKPSKQILGKIDKKINSEWQNVCRKDIGKDAAVHKSKLSVSVEPSNFRLNKDTVIFYNYKVNLIYKKRFKIQNISKSMQNVKIETKKLHEYFYIQPEFDIDTFRLCAGMSAYFSVFFRADAYMDVQDLFQVCGHTVKLVTYRDAPNVSVFVLRHVLHANPTQEDFDVARSQALNNTIECGSCFVGEQIEMFLIFKNNSGHGKFFFMTEQQWCSQEIDTVHEDLQLDFGNFSLKPNYFELNTDEFIVIQVTFYGAAVNTCVENLVLVCNNITWESIDFIADVTVFDKYSVSFDESTLITMDAFKTMLRRSTSTILEEVPFMPDLPVVTNLSNKHFVSCAKDLQMKSVSSLEQEQDGDESIPTTMDKDIMVNNSPGCDAVISDSEIIDAGILNYLLQQEIDNVNSVNASVCSFEEGLETSQFIIYFGHSLGYKRMRQNITVFNNSMMSLKYRWSYHETNHSNYKATFKHLLPEWLEIQGEIRNDNFIHSYHNVHFNLNLTPCSVDSGFYAGTIGLIIEEIPRCAVRLIPKNPNFLVIEDINNVNNPVVDVQVAIFDAICYVDPINIMCEPHGVFGMHQYAYGTVAKKEFRLIVECDYDDEFTGYWTMMNPHRVNVKPEKFIIRPGIPHIFDVEVQLEGHQELHDELNVCIDKWYKTTLPFTVYIDKPHLKFNYSSLDLGLLIVGNTYEKKIKMLNRNLVNVYWEIREQYSKEIDRPGKNSVQVSAVNLECGDVEVTYKVTVGESIKWSSTLCLYTVFEGNKTLDAQIPVSYEITENPIYMHTDYSQCPILSPQEVLYINEPKTYKLCFHNISKSNVVYTLGDEYKTNCEHFDIVVAPTCFRVEANQAHRIDITITPMKCGIFDDIYVPFACINESQHLVGEFCPPEPTILTVLLAVEDICVKVTLPCNKSGIATEIIWPPQINYEFIGQEQSSAGETLSVSSDNPQYTGDSLVLGEDDILTMDLIQYLKTIETTGVEQVQEPAKSLSSFSSDTVYTTPSCPKLNVDFDNISNFYVEVCGVPIRKVVTCAIKLENMTPVLGVLQVDEKNFTCREYHKKGIDSVLEKLNYKKNDDWEKQIGEHGLAIKHECLDGINELKPFGTNEIVFSIYGNTWGKYKEEVLIDFNNILPLNVTLFIEVVGIPLEFPIGFNNIHKTAILRFGTLAYKSEFEIRHLQVKNTSMIPVNVVWHIFMRKGHDTLADEPITILFDVFHPNEDDLTLDVKEQQSQGNLMIAHGKCVGKSESQIFKLLPKETLIEPQKTTTLTIGLNPNAFVTTYQQTHIEAYLIGYMQLPQKYKHDTLLYKRATGSEMKPAKVKLTAALELPVLKLEMSANDLHMAIYSDKVIDVGYIKQIKYLTFKNLNHIDADVRFRIDLPFSIDDCKSSMTILPNDHGDVNKVIVKPAESVRLTISYETDRDEMIKIASCLFDDSEEDMLRYNNLDQDQKSFTMLKYLHIEQKGFIRQTVPCSLTIYFPIVEVTQELNFGQVFIGDVRKQLATIKNYSACTIEFTIEQTDIFRVHPENGVIPPGRPCTPMLFDVHIIFIPRSYSKCEETITIQTQIPSLRLQVNVLGYGRQNEKFALPNTC